MHTVKVRDVILGEGRPKICVSITGVTREEILEEAKAFENIPADIAEWRVDWFEQCSDVEIVLDVLKELRAILKETPILFTFRTAKEGGEKVIGVDEYAALNKKAALSGNVDIVDVEAFTGDEIVADIIEKVHKCHVKVIASNHDFDKTPEKDEIVSRLCKMQALGADIPKIAVMPRSKSDVLTLLAATEEMHTKYAYGPIITMSMSGMGLVSRLCGEFFGSAMTFGAAKKASAPGQAEVHALDKILKFIHKSL